MSSENLHPDYLLVRRWAEKVGLTLDVLHDDLGSLQFAEVCGIAGLPVGTIETIRVDLAVHRAPLVVLAEARGWTVEGFIQTHFLWLREFYDNAIDREEIDLLTNPETPDEVDDVGDPEEDPRLEKRREQTDDDVRADALAGMHL